jgi:hypothetical protein
MLDYREQVQSIFDFLKRSEVEQKYPYAYEIYLLTGIEETALTSRTSGSSKFNQDIENGIEKAKQAHGMLRVDVYGGKSANARKLNHYTVNVSGTLTPQKPTMEKDEIQTFIKEEISQIKPQQSGLGDLSNLLGMVTGTGDGSKGIEGLFGLFNTISGNNKEIDRITYQKQLDDFKFETRFNTLQERYEMLRSENAELRVDKERFSNENKELKSEKADLENRLAGYAPNELMKRVAVGVISGIGGRLLSNSPKTAELLGLSPDELKGALGIVDEFGTETPGMIPETGVEISEIGTPKTPEETKKAAIIKNLAEALSTWDLQDIAKIANIVGICLDRSEFIDKTLSFLNQNLQGNQEQAVPEPNQELETPIVEE